MGRTTRKITYEYSEREEFVTVRFVPFKQKGILEISKKTKISGVLIIVPRIKHIKSLCCLQLEEI